MAEQDPGRGAVRFDDEPVAVEAILAGAWWPSRYGDADERGTFNEVTDQKTRAALASLDLTRPIRTYALAETLFNGFPAYGDREYEQRLVVNGFDPGDDFAGIRQSPAPIGPRLLSSLEERVSLTYNMGTKINGLHHVGIADRFYNGARGSDICETWGTSRFGTESQGPIVTRGIVIDVVGHKRASGATEAYHVLPDGAAVLADGYRITQEDLDGALELGGIVDPPSAGDVVLLRTGWRHYIEHDPEHYLAGDLPGLGLRELRTLAARRPAIIGIDAWFFCLCGGGPDHRILGHQEAAVRFGVHVGEAVPCDALVADGVFEFVAIHSPNQARGAVSSNTALVALANPRV